MPVDFHVVNGTFRKHRHAAADDVPQPTGHPIRPKFIKGRASKVWDEYAARAFWLSEVESHLLATWCALTVEIENDLEGTSAARLAQWRAMGSELGFSASTRAMFAPGGDKPKAKKNPQDPSAEFFDD